MNRYPVWKYVLIVIALLLGALYTAPNYFVESPALQVTTGKTTLKITDDTAQRVEAALKQSGVPTQAVGLEGQGSTTSVRARFTTTDEQFKAKLALEKRSIPIRLILTTSSRSTWSRTRRSGCSRSVRCR